MNAYLKKGSIAIADQVLFSGSNFLLNLFLVKLLTPAEYGLFGSLYSLYLLTCIGFIAIFLEPYIYYKNTLGDTRQYTTYHAGFVNTILFLSIGLTLTGYLTRQYIYIYISYTLATCVIYFYKRHYTSILSPKHSLYISISYFILITIGLLILNYVIPQNLFNCFFILNAASLLSVAPMILFNSEFKSLLYRTNDVKNFINILKHQKKYSFHCLTSGLLAWIPNNIYFIILPIFHSKETNALFKALQNISLPITHLNIAIVSLLVPIFLKSFNPKKLIKQISIAFTLVPTLYLLIILISLNTIEHQIYNDKYKLSPILVTILLLGIIPEIISNIYKAFFRSIEKPEIVTRINLINACLAFACLYLVYKLGVMGILISHTIINISNLISALYFFKAVTKKKQTMIYALSKPTLIA